MTARRTIAPGVRTARARLALLAELAEALRHEPDLRVRTDGILRVLRSARADQIAASDEADDERERDEVVGEVDEFRIVDRRRRRKDVTDGME